MLVELKITDFATIENLRLIFNPSFNVLTGETGAGKSIILDAVTMLLGGRADTSFIRAGSERASIEGIFMLSSRLQNLINSHLETEGLEGDDPDTLILGRELRRTGRSFARINGRTVTLSLMAEIARPLIDIHGQNEHLSLLQVTQHQRLLDRYARLDSEREIFATEARHLYQVRRKLKHLLQNQAELARRQDQLTFQFEEIEAANLQPGEDAELEIERNRLANAEQLSQLSAQAYNLLVEGEEEGQICVIDMLGQISRAFSQLTRLDPSTTEELERVDNLTYQAEEMGTFLRNYIDDIDFNPRRLQQVEERLHLIFSLKRKYGDTIEQILQFAEAASEELDTLTHSEERINQLRQQEEALRAQVGTLALGLSEARRAAGTTMAEGIVKQLADLGMPHTRFSVAQSWKDDPQGVYITPAPAQKKKGQKTKKTVAFDERGIDQIEFLITPNPGEPLKPLVKVASGGETSRIMLALKTVLASADDTPTLIFDEIDQGIGGRIGSVIGRKLWELSDQGNHQVLCVTHLPQIASYADAHYHVSKRISKKHTETQVEMLQNEAQVTELAQMLGAVSDSTRASAREILDQAVAVKVN